MNTEEVVAVTAENARRLLFDADGKPKGQDHFLAELTLHTVIRPATQAKPQLGQSSFDWDGQPYIYDSGIALLFLHDAGNGDPTADRILCNAAAVVLMMTGGISDLRLRKYAAKRLSGDIKVHDKRGRGRSAADNAYRDSVIAGRLIPPLLTDFNATRNEATPRDALLAAWVERSATVSNQAKLER
jgi:hypothetical protein